MQAQPRSASSATLNGSQAPNSISRSVEKWFDVPPSGIGAPDASSPGSSRSNHIEYSLVNQRVSRFWRWL